MPFKEPDPITESMIRAYSQPESTITTTAKEPPTKKKVKVQQPKPCPTIIPFKVKKFLTRSMAGCKKATGFTAAEIFEMLGWE